MRYQVPQFIDVEDTIIGPLTFKQFLYLGGGIGLGYLSYAYLPGFLAVPVGIGLFGLGISLAFVKVNNKPFVYMAEAFFRYLFHPKLYVWKKVEKKEKPKKIEEDPTAKTQKQPGSDISRQNLKDLAWSLDIHDRNQNRNN